MLLARLGIAALAGLAFLLAGALASRDTWAADAAAAGAGMAREHVIGDPNAPVTIVEYASLSCPHCAAFHEETLPALKARYIDPGKVRLVFRDFPLERNAFNASMLAQCAGPEGQGRLVDVFFAQQERWSRAKDPTAALKQLAKLGGMGEAEIDACLSDKAVEDRVLRTKLDAKQSHDGRSTPSFVVAGRTYVGALSIDELAGIVDPLLL